jgi:hypothetical protein
VHFFEPWFHFVLLDALWLRVWGGAQEVSQVQFVAHEGDRDFGVVGNLGGVRRVADQLFVQICRRCERFSISAVIAKYDGMEVAVLLEFDPKLRIDTLKLSFLSLPLRQFSHGWVP